MVAASWGLGWRRRGGRAGSGIVLVELPKEE